MEFKRKYLAFIKVSFTFFCTLLLHIISFCQTAGYLQFHLYDSCKNLVTFKDTSYKLYKITNEGEKLFIKCEHALISKGERHLMSDSGFYDFPIDIGFLQDTYVFEIVKNNQMADTMRLKLYLHKISHNYCIDSIFFRKGNYILDINEILNAEKQLFKDNDDIYHLKGSYIKKDE